jgi:hypothetical protein
LSIGAELKSLRPLWSNHSLGIKGFELGTQSLLISPEEADDFRLDAKASERYLFPYMNGNDLKDGRCWRVVIDAHDANWEEVAKCPALASYLLDAVKASRNANAENRVLAQWWKFRRSGQQLRDALSGTSRFIATTRTSKHRVFQFLSPEVRAESKIVAVATEKSEYLAILSSRVHVHFATVRGGRQGVGNDPVYQHTETFDTFPFPFLSKESEENLADLGDQLVQFRERILKQFPDLTITKLYNVFERAREVEAGNAAASLSDEEKELNRTAQIGVLKDLHDRIDRAVLEAYGWSDLARSIVGKPGGLTPSLLKSPDQEAAEEDLLKRLVELNRDRVRDEAGGDIHWLRPTFQKPRLAAKAPQPATAQQVEAELVAAVGPVEKIAWPKDGLEQIKVVRAALGDANAPISVPDLDARFKGGRKRQERLADLLAYMSETGMVRAQEGDAARRYFIPM